MNKLEHKCEYCSVTFYNDYRIYARTIKKNPVPRFCSKTCMASNSAKAGHTAELNRSRSLKATTFLTGRKQSQETRQKISDTRRKIYLTKPINVKGVTLNITHKQLLEYKELHKVCEICSEPCTTGRKLARDHKSGTNVFRGLLCAKCNMNYDWFLQNEIGISNYKIKELI